MRTSLIHDHCSGCRFQPRMYFSLPRRWHPWFLEVTHPRDPVQMSLYWQDKLPLAFRHALCCVHSFCREIFGQPGGLWGRPLCPWCGSVCLPNYWFGRFLPICACLVIYFIDGSVVVWGVYIPWGDVELSCGTVSLSIIKTPNFTNYLFPMKRYCCDWNIEITISINYFII